MGKEVVPGSRRPNESNGGSVREGFGHVRIYMKDTAEPVRMRQKVKRGSMGDMGIPVYGMRYRK